MKILGIIILVLGIIMTTFTGFTLITKDKVVDAGPIEISKEHKHPIYWSPITGVVLGVIGAVLLIAPGKKGKLSKS